jgi:glycerol-3-phosphate dehydrogenase
MDFAQRGRKAHVYERQSLHSKTSTVSSKLMLGDIRFHELGEIGLVREALVERGWWVENTLQHVKPLRIFIPCYRNHRRSLLELYFGMKVYQWMAGQYFIGPSRLNTCVKAESGFFSLVSSGFSGAVKFFDAQMVDVGLGALVVSQVKNLGVDIHEYSPVERISTFGGVYLKNEDFGRRFGVVINAAGPWTIQLL